MIESGSGGNGMGTPIVWRACLFLFASVFAMLFAGEPEAGKGAGMDLEKTENRLKEHLAELTVGIGERSVEVPENLDRTAEYIEAFYKELGIPVRKEPYKYLNDTVFNVVAEVVSGKPPRKRYLLGAHYDSVAGTVGADDNASAIAVQLETAREFDRIVRSEKLDMEVAFVSFALEEMPAYGTSRMGSKVYAKNALEREERIDGMICLEMVGYTCLEPGCQQYPFPLQYFGYPETGEFIGIVGNFKSRGFTGELFRQFGKNKELPVVKLHVPFDGWVIPQVRLSDHASFWDAGFKAVMVTDSAFFRNPYYHTPFDTMEKLDYGFMAELVESLLLFFRSEGNSGMTKE